MLPIGVENEVIEEKDDALEESNQHYEVFSK